MIERRMCILYDLWEFPHSIVITFRDECVDDVWMAWATTIGIRNPCGGDRVCEMMMTKRLVIGVVARNRPIGRNPSQTIFDFSEMYGSGHCQNIRPHGQRYHIGSFQNLKQSRIAFQNGIKLSLFGFWKGSLRRYELTNAGIIIFFFLKKLLSTMPFLFEDVRYEQVITFQNF
jgi:hypothetical protein